MCAYPTTAASAVVLMLCMASLAGCGKERQPPTPVAGGQAEQGRRLLDQYQCGACHRIPGVAAARSSVGPALDTFGRHSYIAGHIPNYPDALTRWISDPSAMKPGTPMPDMGVSADDARHIAAYLYTLR